MIGNFSLLSRFALAALALCLVGCGGSSTPPSNAPAPKPPKILLFYPTTNPAPQGQDFTLCYGTEEADEVKITPILETISPSLSRCVNANITKPTVFQIMAKGPGGQVQQEVLVNVGKPQPKDSAKHLIRYLNYFGNPPFAPGSVVSICYKTEPGVSITFTPNVRQAPQAGEHCVQQPVQQTTTYLMSATNSANEMDRMQVTIPVK